MKAVPLLISWHEDNAPMYSVHFDPHGKGRLATAANDNNVRLWRVEANGDERKVTYLSTLIKHTQAVNVVRFSPKGEMLASAGDDGNVLLWVPSELGSHAPLGEDTSDDKESWRVKHMCRSSGAEIYDLAWSPDGVFIITGSMDNVARIYNAQTGQMVRQIAEHSHYVQGVAWDPLNEFVATQSSDRSVHIYSLKTKDGQFTLTPHGKVLRMDLPARRISSNSPAPPDIGPRSAATSSAITASSPVPSTPGTPMAAALPMDPPPISHSRRSSFGSSRRSASPAPSLPLPAVKPLEMPSPGLYGSYGVKNTNVYANETLTSFFRRLTFSPDGSLLFTPAGQYKTSHQSSVDPAKTIETIINTVYIYTRAGLNKHPIAHLPGHKKPSIAVKCSPVLYTLRTVPQATRNITVDTSSGDGSFPALPDSLVSSNTPTKHEPAQMKPPTSATNLSKAPDSVENSGPPPAFSLPYRVVYAVATQDAILVYDTQQQSPLCIVSNLHYATFTDLAWASDGLTLIMASSDGFCSTLAFSPAELGQPYNGPIERPAVPATNTSTPLPTPSVTSSPSAKGSLFHGPPAPPPRTSSPTGSAVSGFIPTPASVAPPSNAPASLVNNPTPTLTSVPSVTAVHSAQPPTLPLTTPPQTPLSGVSVSAASSSNGNVLGKRDGGAANESEREDMAGDAKNGDASTAAQEKPKRRRIAPTPVLDNQTAPQKSEKDDRNGGV